RCWPAPRSRWASPTSRCRCRWTWRWRTTPARCCCCSCWCRCWRGCGRWTDGGDRRRAGLDPPRCQPQALPCRGRSDGGSRPALRFGDVAGLVESGGVMKGIAGQYWELTKPRVVSLIVFTAVVGMFLAVPGLPPLREGVFGILGIWLAAASAAAINHLIDQRIDKVMVRTANRPLATGTLKPAQVLAFAVFLGAASMTILIALVNPLTAGLTFASLIGYAIVYTGFLKRATPQNIVIGGIAGAAPPLLGWAAVTGMQGRWDWAHALLLVLIVFVWTPPHFWARAIFRR